MNISIEDIEELDPCYTDDQLREVFAGQEYLTLADIPSLTIPKKDILWVLSHYLPDPRAFARRVALDVVHLWECPIVVFEWLTTGDENLRDAARVAARAATENAARDATWNAAPVTVARNAARNAAWDATRAATENAAWAATRAAAGAAARAAARAATENKYIRWAIEEIEEIEK